jgi:DNA-binding transcriptional MocR family regulator
MAEVACHAIESGRLDVIINEKKEEIRERQRMVDYLFEGLDYISQAECPHTWLNLPEPWQADEFVLELQKKGVLVKAVNSFAVSPTNNMQGIRICLTSPRSREQVEAGLTIIRDTIDRHPGVWQSIM